MFSCEPLVAPGSRYYNYAAGALARSSLLCLQCIGLFTYLPGYQLTRRSYDSFLLEVILDGELETALKFAAERGVDVHLILPGNLENSLRVLDWIGENFAPGEVLVSLMRQYTPMGGLPAPFDRRVTDEEYDAVLSWMYLNELEGFTQEAEAADTGFIPDFLAD